MKLHSILLLLTLWTPFLYAESGQLVGQGNDGNRSMPVHRIEVYDDQGYQIRSFHENPKPFSTRTTCGRCHNYNQIASGWHFNGHDSEVAAGRPGQPWVLTDSKTRTQLPISDRQWPGTFTPQQLGISPWEMVKMNFSHFPGGSYGEMKAEHPYEMTRQEISGSYEINCLACHNADPHQDQDMAALQAARQNYRWIPAASSQMAAVKGDTLDLTIFHDPDEGTGPKLTYRDGVFDSEDKVFFDIAGKPSNKRCYFCHSNQNLSVGEDYEWTRDEDVHLNAGLNCVDCHRNGDDHMITRGTETEGHSATLSCQGCHLGDSEDIPTAGRLGAPKPAHRGIPTVHFEKMTCTSCHSGPWPKEQTDRWKTARMHKTGLHGKHTPYVPQPHVYAPVLMKGEDGKIAPYKMFWPAYWAVLKDGSPSPIAPDRVMELAGDILDTGNEKVDDWQLLTELQIADVLTRLSSDGEKGVYVAGGRLYQLDANGRVMSTEDKVAKPYAWPMAHDVRPAAQSLGVRTCKDCHVTDSPVFFGSVEIDTPIKADGSPELVEMVTLQGIDRLYMQAFNASFVFRPFLKIIAFASCALIALILLGYAVRPIVVISSTCSEESEFASRGVEPQGATCSKKSKSNWIVKLRGLFFLAGLFSFCVLLVTGFGPLVWGGKLHGYVLMAHATFSPVFIGCLALFALFSARQYHFNKHNTASKVFYWALLVLSLPVTLTMAISMLPVFGTQGQEILLEMHRWFALAFCLVAIAEIFMLIRTRFPKGTGSRP